MKNFFEFIQRFHFFFLFVFLEIVSLSVVINSFSDKKSAFVSTVNSINGFIYDQFSDIKKIWSLREINALLENENVKYRNLSKKAYKASYLTESELRSKESGYILNYYSHSAFVVNNTIHKNHNFITLDKGYSDGIKTDMVVISDVGVVGIITAVSKNYSLAMSMLNVNSGVSAKLKSSNYFGSISWDGIDYKTVTLNDIPNHVKFNNGDTIVTSGYSSLFPEGILIGTVESFYEKPGDSFYNIKVKVAVDFKNIYHVYIVDNLLRQERLGLENQAFEN